VLKPGKPVIPVVSPSIVVKSYFHHLFMLVVRIKLNTRLWLGRVRGSPSHVQVTELAGAVSVLGEKSTKRFREKCLQV